MRKKTGKTASWMKRGQSGEPVFLRTRETVVVTTAHVPVRLP